MDVLDLHGGRPPAPGARADVAVARGWEATAFLWDVEATRRVHAVDHLAHEALGPWQAERIAAQLSYALPVDFVAYGTTLAARLRELRPDARVVELRRGVERTVRGERPDGPLRVHGDAGAMAEPHAHAELHEADAAVGVDALDALAAGAIPLTTGHDLVVHLETGIVVEPDDARGTARWLDTLARDAELRERLRAAGQRRLDGWPTPDEAAAEERAALQRLLDEDPPHDDAWGARVMQDALAAVAVWRNEHFKLAAELERLQADEAVIAGLKARDTWRTDPRLRPVRAVVRRARGR